jgi:hypothetical protein
MCRGLAAGYNIKTHKMICKGKSSHTDTLGNKEDDCIKLELIATDTNDRRFIVELDEQYDKDDYVLKKFPGWITKGWQISKKLNDVIEKWISENELFICRSLITLQSYARYEGSINNSCQNGNHIYNQYQKSKRVINNSSQKAKEHLNNSHQVCEGSISNFHQESDGTINNVLQISKGDINNYFQKSDQEIYIQGTKLTKYPRTSTLLRADSLTLVELISGVINNHEKCKEIMGDELVKDMRIGE